MHSASIRRLTRGGVNMDKQTVLKAFEDLKVEKAKIVLHALDHKEYSKSENNDVYDIELITFSDIDYDKLQQHAETMGEGSTMTETVRDFYADFNDLVEARRMETEGILSDILTPYLLNNFEYNEVWKNHEDYATFVFCVTRRRHSLPRPHSTSELTLTISKHKEFKD